MNIMNLIDNYVKSFDIGMPIYSNNICKYVIAIYDTKTNIVTEYINRYEERNDDFIRYRKGIYYRGIKTPFGYSKINYNKLVKDLYINNQGDIYGYISGPSFANKIGLTTQIPREEYIVTNYNRVIIDIYNIKLLKPVVTITKDNYKILQVLDLLTNKYNVNYECENPDKVIYDYINDNHISFESLLYYSKYYNKNVLFKLQDICFQR